MYSSMDKRGTTETLSMGNPPSTNLGMKSFWASASVASDDTTIKPDFGFCIRISRQQSRAA